MEDCLVCERIALTKEGKVNNMRRNYIFWNRNTG